MILYQNTSKKRTIITHIGATIDYEIVSKMLISGAKVAWDGCLDYYYFKKYNFLLEFNN